MAISLAPPAVATVNGDYTASSVRIRRSPSTSDPVIYGLGYQGDGAWLWCYKHGTNVGGTTLWYNHTNKRTRVRGYSTAYYMDWWGQEPLNPC